MFNFVPILISVVLLHGISVQALGHQRQHTDNICLNRTRIRKRFDNMFPDSLVDHLSGPYLVGGGVSFLWAEGLASPVKRNSTRKASLCPVQNCPNSEGYLELVKLYGGIPRASSRLKDLAKLRNISYDFVVCRSFCEQLRDLFKKRRETLVVITTLNHFEMTSQLVESLSNLKDEFDLLFVDDYSVDGTAGFLIKKGFAVIRNTAPRGLTYSWNIAYRLAKLLKYKYVFLGNNDIILPDGSISVMRDVLRENASVVVPTTNHRGAGHNPSQSFRYVHNLIPQLETYIDNPCNMQKIQKSLSEQLKRLKNSDDTSFLSEWNGKAKFNGFMFGLNLKLLNLCEFDEKLLFDPVNRIVGQEDSLMKCLGSFSLFPRVAKYAFVYHYKSRTVGVANYTAGNPQETRNELNLYHTPKVIPESGDLNSAFESYVLKYAVFPPADNQPDEFCIATSNPALNPSAGDIMTAKELATSLNKTGAVSVRLLNQGPAWYDVKSCDVLIALLPSFDPAKIIRAKPSLMKIVWIRNWFHLFFGAPYLGSFDLVLASSDVAVMYFDESRDFNVQCVERCPDVFAKLIGRRSPVTIKTLLLATNPAAFSKPNTLEVNNKTFHRDIDYLFSGNYWNCHREIMELDPNGVGEYIGHVYGKGWEQSPVNTTWRRILRGSVVYEKLPFLYQSVNILIDDANHVTKPWGAVNSRVFDGLVSGALVITNGEIGSNCSFGGLIPSYRNIKDLEGKLKYYLQNESQRVLISRGLQELVLRDHTYDIRAEQLLHHVIEAGYSFKLPTNSSIHHHKSCICVGVRIYEGQKDYIEISVANILAQYKTSAYSQSVCVRIFLVNTDVASPQFKDSLEKMILRFNTEHDLAIVSLVAANNAPPRQEKNALYGYDDSDMLLDYMVHNPICSHIMLSNGDNLYNKAWFDTVAPLTLNESLHLIGWNFVTHHKRNNLSQQLIRTELVRQKVDLGSVLISKKAFQVSGASFLPSGAFTGDIFARDFFAIKTVEASLSPPNIMILPQVLLFHQ